MSVIFSPTSVLFVTIITLELVPFLSGKTHGYFFEVSRADNCGYYSFTKPQLGPQLEPQSEVHLFQRCNK